MATIQKRGTSYRFTVSCGYDINGKQIRKTMTWTPPEGMTTRKAEREAQHQAALFEEKCRSGQVLDGSIKFAAFVEQWMREYAEKQLKPKTLKTYRTFLPRINAAIGHIRIDRIQPQHLMDFYDNLSESGIRLDTKYHKRIDFEMHIPTTQVEFSETAGIGHRTITAFLCGENISRASAEKISKALNLPLETVFDAVDRGKLSGNTVVRYHQLISSILETAVHWQLIPANPCRRVKPPRVEHKEACYLDEAQAAHLMELLDSEPIQYRTAVLLLLNTGLRRGELCGLEWKDIDFEKAILQVRRNTLYLPGHGVFDDTPKTANAQRAIKIPAACIPMLKEYRAWQGKERLRLGDQWHDHDKLFTRWNGKPMYPEVLTSWFSEFIKRSDLPHITLHSLRHTNATLLIAAGTNLRTVSARLGHSKTSITSDIYAHAIQSADAAAAETLDNILSPKTPKLKAVSTE